MAVMQRVTLKTRLAGPWGTFGPGATISVDDVTARDLIAGGYAVAAKAVAEKPAEAKVPPKPVETADAPVADETTDVAPDVEAPRPKRRARKKNR